MQASFIVPASYPQIVEVKHSLFFTSGTLITTDYCRQKEFLPAEHDL